MSSVFSKRILAFILDFFVVSAIMWIISYAIFNIMNPYDTYKVYPFLIYVVPFLIMIYFVGTEKLFGATIGKAILNLQVKSKNGANISWLQAIMRNITKIYWIPIIFDWFFGKLLKSDRLFNNISKTIVVDYYD